MEELLRETTAYKILDGDRRQNKLSHAYMLHFPDSSNLKEALKRFALNFFGASGIMMRRILLENYSDFKIYPKDGKKLDAAAVTEILEDSALRPVEGDKKLYAITAFDTASALLQNKLLKTLEEPLEGIHFLLGVTSLAPVLDTVKSRVKLLEIPPFSEEQIFAALERKIGTDSELNAAAARSCNGVLGAAENMISGGWFKDIMTAAKEICSVTKEWQIGTLAIKYGETKYKNELLSEMQRLYFTALRDNGGLPLERPALIYALENLAGAFADVKFNAFFQGLLYDFMLKVVKENDKWQKLRQ